MVLCTYRCYAREEVTQGVGFLSNTTPQGKHVKMQYINCILYHLLPFCFKSYSSWATSCFRKNPYHYEQLGGSEREGREQELDLHVPSYQNTVCHAIN